MRAAGAFIGGAALALVLGGGCSVIVPSTLDHVKCSKPGAIGEPDCGPGQVCAAGQCVACQQKDACGDGVDNDCNGVVDDGCGDGGTADTSVGKSCGTGAGCPPGLFCLDPEAVLGQPGTPFCTRGCCTSAECGSGDAVCWPTSKGAAVCRRASEVNRGTPGSAPDGAGCGANTDCRSGACSNGVCIDTCCVNSDCPSPAAPSCALGPVQSKAYDAFYCAGGGAGAFGQGCARDSDCQSQACMQVSYNSAICSQPCCKSSDCGDNFVCAYFDNGGQPVRLCGPQNNIGSGATGAKCGSDADCRSGKCLDYKGQQVCSDACCRDTDCGNSKLGCRPVRINDTYVLRCVPL